MCKYSSPWQASAAWSNVGGGETVLEPCVICPYKSDHHPGSTQARMFWFCAVSACSCRCSVARMRAGSLVSVNLCEVWDSGSGEVDFRVGSFVYSSLDRLPWLMALVEQSRCLSSAEDRSKAPSSGRCRVIGADTGRTSSAGFMTNMRCSSCSSLLSEE